ncbi:hypothetical protein [Variovorax sp. LT1R16]|uniref:hypothetical protein n=1 Tax=Variovorax sp. LT1R16 TaxID=3443728 RepID=UPI003F480360
MLDRSKIFPAIAQRGILSTLGSKPYEYWDLGPRVSALLWEDLGSATRAITPAEASTWAGSEHEAATIAMANLGREIQESRLLLGIAELPNGGKFAFFDQHWLAGATVLHNGLMPWIANSLGASQLMASVPAPESVAYFASDCSDEVRQAVEVFVIRAGQESRKPLGRNEYRFVDGEPVLVD